MYIKRLNFIALSALMRSRSLSGLTTRQLKVRLEACVGGAQIDPLTPGRLPQGLRPLAGSRSPQEWFKNIILHGEPLRERWLDYLVLDTLQYTSESALNEVGTMLQTLSQQGVQIVVVDHHQTPIFFASMREIIRADAFIDIYVRSLWKQSRSLEPERRVTGGTDKLKPIRAAARFQYMERIFVS